MSIEETPIPLMEKYRLEQTCGACPEAYDVFLGDVEAGTLRLRHGHFVARAESDSTTVYEASPSGDGIFDAGERDHYMHEAIRRLDAYVDPEGEWGLVDPDEPVPEIDDDPDMPKM